MLICIAELLSIKKVLVQFPALVLSGCSFIQSKNKSVSFMKLICQKVGVGLVKCLCVMDWSCPAYSSFYNPQRDWVERDNLRNEHLWILTAEDCLSFHLSSFCLPFFIFLYQFVSVNLCSPAIPGPMVWYQKFEYAVGHWLQKTSEHVFGSVLCSPGCFSLFRGSALMDDNVLKRYTTTASRASEYVQYDQGWLGSAQTIFTLPSFVSLPFFFDCAR